MTDKRWNVDKKKLESPRIKKIHHGFDQARSQMTARTKRYELYGLIAKNKSIDDWINNRKDSKRFSEGSTQYILRKVLADTIQRVPDGEIVSQYDNDSREQIVLEYLFKNKIMSSEIAGSDMMANLTKAFKMSFIYAFAPVRTGFVKDYDDDARISFNLEQWSDVFINPDCKDICHPEVVYHQSYLTKDEVLSLIDEEGNVTDSTYNEDAIHCVLDENLFGAKQYESETLSDKLKGATSQNSLRLITEYRQGSKEFITFIPCLNAEFRKVPNYDPRKRIPWNFMVLEPDADFPLGISQVEFLLADQQFNDLFQTSAYKNLLLAMEPPIKVSGWETNPASYQFKPRKIWNLGNNPNQVMVEPVKIENAILNNWTQTRESVAAAMVRNLNVADGTIAADSGVNFSKTAPGVEQQKNAKTISINQYQKRVEIFMQEWATQALQMYINSMHGEHTLTVDEDTRRRLYDIDAMDMIDGDDITVDFDSLSVSTLEFNVRVGSLIQKKEDQELDKLTTMVQPLIQNLNGWSEENRQVIENEVLLPVVMRMIELTDTDISKTMANSISQQIAKSMLSDVQGQIDGQQQQINGMQDQIDSMQPQEQLDQEPLAGSNPAPLPQENPDNAAGQMGQGNTFAEPLPASPRITPGQQVDEVSPLLTL